MLKEIRDLKGQQDHRVTKDPRVIQVLKEPMELKVMTVLKVPMEP